MPPIVALTLCILFIICIFKLERDRKPNAPVSLALWIPTIWLMIIGSRMVYYWLNLQPDMTISSDVYSAGNPIDRTIFIILILAGILILFKRRIAWAETLKTNVWIIIFFAYCAFSISWADLPFVAFKRYTKAIGCLIMMMVILTEPAPINAIKVVIRRCAFIFMPLSIVLIKYYPHYGRVYRQWSGELMITGVAGNKNTLGILCTVCGIVMVTDLLKTWRNRNTISNINTNKVLFFQLIILIMTLWLLVKSNSATAYLCFIIGCITLIGMDLTIIRNNIKNIGYFIFFILLGGIILQYGFDVTQIIVSNLGRDETLTGRTDIWKEALAMVTSPLNGVGFESFWMGNRLERFVEKFGPFGKEVHNGYIEIYLDLGLIGVSLLIAVIINAFKAVVAELKSDYDYGKLFMTFWIIAILYNITESAFRPMQLMGFIFFLIAIKTPQTADSGKSNGG